MAFVFDHSDPSNLGMFSKPGRFTGEKYIIFQKKDEIINNQRKFLKVTSLPHLKMDFEGKDRTKGEQDEEEDRPKTKSPTKTKPEFAPFSQQISRDDYYEVKKVKNPPPPFGFYNPKHDYVERTPQTLFKYDKEKSKEQFKSTMTDFDPEEASRPLPNKAEKKVPGPVNFHQQVSRGTLLSPSNHPHDDRFNYLESPKNSSKTRKMMSVDMKKTLGRDHKPMFKNLEYSPDYDPNFEYGRKQLGSPGPTFETKSPRKPLINVSACTNDNFFDKSKSETLKFSKTQDTFFTKGKGRDWDSSSPLPSFMQKTVTSRFAIGTLSQKTLEINNFSDGKFQTVTTGFFNPKSAKCA